jgi:gliding motility-associated-like protein
LNALGITLLAGDTVEFRANFTLNPDGPYPAQFRKVHNLRGYGYAQVDGVQESCDNFGDIITVAKNQTVFNIPSSSAFPEGCQESFLNYQLITVNNGFVDYFGNEYRQAIGVDSLIIQFDTAVFEAYDVFEPQVAFPGHPVHGNNYFDAPPFTDFSDGRYILYFDTLMQVPALNNVSSYSFSFRVRTIPNCKTMFASSSGDNIYDMDPEIYFVDRYYARDIGDGSCANVRNEALNNDIVYEEPPTFDFSYISNPNYDLAADTAEWVLQHCNTSFTSDAGLTWIAIEDSTNAIEIVSIEDISDPSNPVSLSFSNYGSIGSNTFAFASGLTRGDGMAPIEDVCNTIRIKALVNICGITDFHAKVGWNCVAYSDPSWNPEDNPPCDDISLPLRVTTLDPFLDANIIEQPTSNPDICDTSTIAILVRNTNQGSAYDVITQLLLPFEGAEIVPSSVEIAYPSSAPFVSVPTDPYFAGTTTRGRIFQYDDFAPLHPYLDVNGLPGFNPISPSDSNEFVIRYRFVTNCEFLSGSILYYQLQGLKGCGDSTNFETGETLPIYINGADPGLSKIFDVKFNDGSILNHGGTSTISITATNLTTTPSDTTDKIVLSIPLDMDYQLGSSLIITPPSWILTEPERDTVAGFEQLYWCMPAGLLQGDSLSFQLNLTTPEYTCSVDSVDIGLITVLQQDLTCSSTLTSCNVEAITSSNNGAMSALAVNQQSLDLTITGLSSFCISPTEEQLTVDGLLTNFGNDFTASNFTFRYYHDQDNSGDLTPGDPELINFVENGPILSGAAQAFQHTFTVNTANVCSIIGLIDTTGLDLCGDASFLIDDVQLLNAGSDILLCETSPTLVSANLGDASCAGMVGYTYQWFAIAPADISDLYDPTSATPIFSFNFDGVTEDTLQYYVETTRPGCFAISRDTVQIILGAGVNINLGNDIIIPNGSSVILNSNPTGGTMPYNYSWAPAATLDDANASQPLATPVQDTTEYVVTVTTASGCTAIDSVLVIWESATPCVIPLTSVTVSEATCGNNDGAVTLHLGGLEADYQYDWSPDMGNSIGDGNQRINIPVGGYTVLITDLDDSNCSTSLDILVQNSDGPMVGVNASSADCGQLNGAANLLPANYDYLWPDNSTSNNRFDLAAGTYFVTFTDPGDPSCPNIVEITIDENSNLNASLTVVSTPDCGMANGAVSVNVNGGVGPYTFSWPGGTNTQNNLSAGVYTVTISDQGASGTCNLTYTFALVDNVAPATITIVDTTAVDCAGEATGAITFEVIYDAAFVGPADTIITDGVITYSNTNLPEGNYCMIIRDGNACIAGEACFTIETPDPLLFWFTVDAACENGGSVDLEVIGGTGPFVIDWMDIPGADDPEDLTNLGAGIYPLTVTDNNACVLSDFVEIEPCDCEPPQLNSVLVVESTCGNADGTATIHMMENDSLYTYSWVPDLGVTSGLGNSKVNLPFGGYTVNVANATDSTCFTEVLVLVTNADGPTATVITTAATCQNTDGTATLSPPDYQYEWEDGVQAPSRNDLAAGSYFVTLTDTNNAPDCPNVILFTIEEDNPLTADITVNNAPDCGVSNGNVTINVNNGSGSYTFSWEDGLMGNSSTRDSIASGVYTVTISDNGPVGCELEFSFIILDDMGTASLNITDTVDVSCANGNDGGVLFEVNYLPGFNAPGDTIITDGINIFENGSLPVGDYCIYITDTGGCLVAGNCFSVAEPEPMDLYIVLTPSCDTLGCAEVTVNGGTAPFTFDWGHLTGVNDPANICQLSDTIYQLSVTDANACVINEDAVIIPGCSNDCDFFGGLENLLTEAPNCQSPALVCINYPLQEVFNLEILDNGSPYDRTLTGCDFDSLVVYAYSELFGQGNLGPYEVISWAVNENTYSGEFLDIPALIDSMNTWDPLGNWSISSVGQFITGGDASSNYSAILIDAINFGTISELGVNFSAIPNGFQLELMPGEHEIVIIDMASSCSDTLAVNVSCTDVINICVNDISTFCVDENTLNLSGPVSSMINVCSESSDGSVDFIYDPANLCVDYTGVAFGTDTTCIQFCDAAGNCDTVELIVSVDSCVSNTMHNVKDTIFINQTVVYCPDSSSLPGEILSIDNFCEDLSGEFVDYYLNPLTNCVEYTGLELGVDSACVVVCDEFGLCDTTLFCVVVMEYFEGPAAVTDSLCTQEGTPVIINALANDTLYGGIDSIYLLNTPSWGTATLNLDGSITYNADEEICERVDSFFYVVCTPTGCDTAKIEICIECVDIVIFTAVSPNGDGLNDVFYIANIEEYPNNNLKIFNRWGNKVFEIDSYKNQWRGTWNGNRDLPDGTYYYLLELNDEDNRVFEGYLELYR